MCQVANQDNDASKYLAALEAKFAEDYPNLLPPRPARSENRPTRSITLGEADGKPVTLPLQALVRHVHGIGTTGGGKSNFLQLLARQLITAGSGFALLDPHGSKPDGVFRNILKWLAETGMGGALAAQGKLHIIDPNDPTFITGFNPLVRPRPETATSVVAYSMLQAVSRVWGDENMHDKPTILSVLKATFHALTELGLTLAEAKKLYEPKDELGIRANVLSRLNDEYARDVLERLHRIGLEGRTSKEFDAETTGPINRINVFLSSPVVKAIVGQTEKVLHFPTILDESHVLLVNLQDIDYSNPEDADLLGRLLLHQLMFYAKRRKRPDRQFITIVDEAHQFLSGDVDKMLTEARGFGLGLALFHQNMGQLHAAGRWLADAIQDKTATKLVFRLERQEEAEALARAVVPLDLEMPVKALIRPAAVAQEIIELTGRGYSKSVMEGIARGLSYGISETEGSSTSSGSGSVEGQSALQLMTPDEGWLTIPDVLSQSAGVSSALSNFTGFSQMQSVTESLARSIVKHISSGTSASESVSQSLATVYKELPSSVHGLENATYMAAATLRKLKTGTCFIRHADIATVITTPLASSAKPKPGAVKRLKQRVMETSHAALPAHEAYENVRKRSADLIAASTPPDDDDHASPEPFMGYYPGQEENLIQKLADKLTPDPPPRGVKPRIVKDDDNDDDPPPAAA